MADSPGLKKQLHHGPNKSVNEKLFDVHDRCLRTTLRNLLTPNIVNLSLFICRHAPYNPHTSLLTTHTNTHLFHFLHSSYPELTPPDWQCGWFLLSGCLKWALSHHSCLSTTALPLSDPALTFSVGRISPPNFFTSSSINPSYGPI